MLGWIVPERWCSSTYMHSRLESLVSVTRFSLKVRCSTFVLHHNLSYIAWGIIAKHLKGFLVVFGNFFLKTANSSLLVDNAFMEATARSHRDRVVLLCVNLQPSLCILPNSTKPYQSGSLIPPETVRTCMSSKIQMPYKAACWNTQSMTCPYVFPCTCKTWPKIALEGQTLARSVVFRQQLYFERPWWPLSVCFDQEGWAAHRQEGSVTSELIRFLQLSSRHKNLCHDAQ